LPFENTGAIDLNLYNYKSNGIDVVKKLVVSQTERGPAFSTTFGREWRGTVLRPLFDSDCPSIVHPPSVGL